MMKLINAAGVSVEAVWPTLFARALEGKDIGALVSNVGSGAAATVASTAAAGGADAGGTQEAKEEKKEEKVEESEESDDDMGFGEFVVQVSFQPDLLGLSFVSMLQIM